MKWFSLACRIGESGMKHLDRVLRVCRFIFIILATSGVALFAQDDAAASFNKKCAVCHAKDGSGNTAKGKSLHVKDVRQTIKESDEAAMIKVVTEGKGEMDSYKDQFTSDQVKALVEYYRSLAK
jgi:mono/diheme cytochrome c family protein